MTAVQVRALRRTFSTGKADAAERVALDGIDLDIKAGTVHGLLGPNGAGKTTLCKVLSTVLLPTSGRALVLGRDPAADPRGVRPLVGIVLGGDRGLYGRLTARQNIRFWAALYGIRRAEAAVRTAELLDRFGLADHADEPVERFSRGMKQRLHLARGLIHRPPVVLLDEPTTGMDPVSARAFRDVVADLRTEGHTVLLTTHDMAEAEALCDRVTLIDRGTVLATAHPRELGEWFGGYERVEARDVPEAVRPELLALDGVAALEDLGDGRIRIQVRGADRSAAVLSVLLDAGVRELSTSPPGLEELYLQVIGDRGFRVGAR
ncbi:ABC transporter ATP-binding protein [Kitasatospora sp. NPDC059648]|uniref:ABC transporter ATP-binding protein n=1 Tax=Kitasatospora sp. NPDC059648 TaxID=3346894 RepID=UPI0036C98029